MLHLYLATSGVLILKCWKCLECLELNANVKNCTSALTLDQLLRAVLRNNGRLLESWILVHLVPHYFTCAEQGVFLRLGLLNKT